MAQTEFNQLLQTARDLNFASNKLLVIAGAKGSGKTDLVQKVSAQLSRQRRLKAEEVVADALDATGHRALCLDNTEVLFDTALAINPVNLLLNLSRNRLLVVAWNGHLESGSLVYAYPEHPEHFKGPANGFPVVSVTDEKLHLFLQP
jgi:ABC-type transport system involved in cytochrome bd biosynthesis fused ATPase/permease subunit